MCSYDFVSSQTTDGKALRFLTVIDEYTRRGLWIECARHLTSFEVVRVLEPLVEVHGAPGLVKSGDGCLNRWLFSSPLEARRITENWLCEYNEERPHGSLGGLVPSTFFERWEEEKKKEAA